MYDKVEKSWRTELKFICNCIIIYIMDKSKTLFNVSKHHLLLDIRNEWLPDPAVLEVSGAQAWKVCFCNQTEVFVHSQRCHSTYWWPWNFRCRAKVGMIPFGGRLKFFSLNEQQSGHFRKPRLYLPSKIIITIKI